ncbi:hypothetical protein [Catenovulum maritimum]|uniref:Lipoprotein n=1 Tax=Catenovulum maritimum TaxID=1513271 RepID=A0A0J8GMD3_9ALTE|nr:hypothetical protein [Catenovulum maritimum]KMT63940.1 hypothetical protein XM47_17080 [Catenovulum maritimum]
MKFTFKQTALTLALAGSLSLTGCNFIGDGDSVFTAAPLDVVTIDGTASKGALEKATVVACEVGTACETAAVAAFGTNNPAGTLAYKADGTDVNGLYSLDVSIEADKAVIVRVLADANTTQTCDYDGCVADDVKDIELKTITFVKQDTPTVSAPVNVLSTIATDTLKSLGGGITTEADFKDSAASASDSVAALLGLADNELTDAGTSLFDAKVTTASLDASSSSDAITKKLTAINASFGVTKDSTTTLATAIKNVSTGVATTLSPVVGTDGKVSVDTSSIATAFTKVSAAVATIATTVGATNVTVPDGAAIQEKVKDAIVKTGVNVSVDDITATGSTGTTGTTGGTN